MAPSAINHYIIFTSSVRGVRTLNQPTLFTSSEFNPSKRRQSTQCKRQHYFHPLHPQRLRLQLQLYLQTAYQQETKLFRNRQSAVHLTYLPYWAVDLLDLKWRTRSSAPSSPTHNKASANSSNSGSNINAAAASQKNNAASAKELPVWLVSILGGTCLCEKFI